MSTYHAAVWLDHAQAHVLMFDREHVQSQRIKSRSHHKHQGKASDAASFFTEIAQALTGVHEVLLTGPGLARQQLRDWCAEHRRAVAAAIVACLPSDHPSDAQLVALARQYFRKFDAMAADPSQA